MNNLPNRQKLGLNPDILSPEAVGVKHYLFVLQFYFTLKPRVLPSLC